MARCHVPVWTAASAVLVGAVVAAAEAGGNLKQQQQQQQEAHHLLTTNEEIESYTSETGAVVLLAVLPRDQSAASTASSNVPAEGAVQTWSALGRVLDARLQTEQSHLDEIGGAGGGWEEDADYHATRMLTQAVLRSRLPAQVSPRFCFADSSSNSSSSGGGENRRADDCTALAASLRIVSLKTPTIMVFAEGIRRRLPDFAAADVHELASYTRWLAIPSLAKVGGDGGNGGSGSGAGAGAGDEESEEQSQVRLLSEYAESLFGSKRNRAGYEKGHEKGYDHENGNRNRNGAGTAAGIQVDTGGYLTSMLVLEVRHRAISISGTGTNEVHRRDGGNTLSVVGLAARRRLDAHKTVAFAEIAWRDASANNHDHDNDNEAHGNPVEADGVGGEVATARSSVVVATTCNGSEAVLCVESALASSLHSDLASRLIRARPRPLCCLGSIPTAFFGAGSKGADRVVEWIGQHMGAPLLTELTAGASRELLPLELPFVVLYLPGVIFSRNACDSIEFDADVMAEDDDDTIRKSESEGGSGIDVQFQRHECEARRYAEAREAHGDLLDVYETAAARFSFGDAEDAAECWESVTLGTETAEQCHAESRRALLFTWAPADVHPNYTDTDASSTAEGDEATGADVFHMNIADYHICKRYDYGYRHLASFLAGSGDDVDSDAANANANANPNPNINPLVEQFFKDYLDGTLNATYLCPPKKHQVAWSIVAALFVGITSLLEALLVRLQLFAPQQEHRPRASLAATKTPTAPASQLEGDGQQHRGFQTKQPMPSSTIRIGKRAPKCRPCRPVALASAPPPKPPRNLPGKGRFEVRAQSDANDGHFVLGLPFFGSKRRRRDLAISVVGGALTTATIWAWNPELVAVPLAALVLCMAAPVSIARSLSAGSHTRRMLETAATAPIAAAAINPEMTFQLINAASCGLRTGMGFPCEGTCCSSGG